MNASPSTTSMRTGWRSPKQAPVKTSQLACVCLDMPVISIDVQITFRATYTMRPKTAQKKDYSHIQLA